MFDLTGKTALVTGATGGIGGAIARALHAQGAKLAISGTRREVLGLHVVVSGVRGIHCGESSQPRKAAVGRASGVLSGRIPWGPQRLASGYGGLPAPRCADVSPRNDLITSRLAKA